MNRRGQGISINMVIIAAIALLVLVVAIVLVSKSGKNVDQNAGTGSCLANGGVCRESAQDCTSNKETRIDKTCSDPNYPTCCRYNFGG